MDLRHAAQGMASGRRLAEAIHRRGMVGKDRSLWKQEEDAILQQHFPDYSRLLKLLPGRSYAAIRARATRFDLVRRKRVWTVREVSVLRRHFATGSHQELEAMLPGRLWRDISAKARSLHIYRQRRPFMPTGSGILDDIRARAFELNLTMGELDAMARTKHYFRNAAWITAGRKPQPKAVFRALKALEGEMAARWADAND